MAHAKIFYDYIAQNSNVEDLVVDIKATYPMQHAPLEEMLNINGENERRQAEIVYPAFIKTANKEGFADIAEKIDKIAKIEAIHADVLQKMYQKLQNNTLYASNMVQLWKCNNCGLEIEAKKAPKKCTLCGKDQGYFRFKLHDCKNDKN
jgi:rubrerythrin